MSRRSGLIWCVALLMVALVAATAYAQATASIAGVVRDSDGGVIPGVTVVVKDDALGTTREAVTGADGTYRVTSLQAGSYTITASLTGFKTAVVKSLKVSVGQPMTASLTLEVGALTETVTVMSSAELINTETAAVTATLNSDQLTRMPTPTRNALNAVTFLPGINTGGTNRDSTILGIPESFVSMTLDGVSNNDNYLRNSDSFFAQVTPRQDAVEAVSVNLAAGGTGTAAAGAGAVTMAFQTRSGSNRLTGSAYEYYRDPRLNTNYYWNRVNGVGKNNVKLNQWGGRLGGPVVIPGVFNGKDKLFFFAHFEKIVIPFTFPRTRTLYSTLTPGQSALDGWFRYQCTSDPSGVCAKNVLAIAQAAGQIYAKDPTMVGDATNPGIFLKEQAAIASFGSGGKLSTTNDPLYDSYVWNSPSQLNERQPTFRVDWNITNKHRLSGSYSIIKAQRTPDYLNTADPRFPGSPNHRDFESTRPLASLSLRSVLGKNLTNELRGGMTAYMKGSFFGYPTRDSAGNILSTKTGNSVDTFADQNGLAIVTPGSTSDWYTSNSPSWRSAPSYSIDETITWQIKKHTVTAGASWMWNKVTSGGEQMVPYAYLGMDATYDPAYSLFSGSTGATNFPGASSTNLTQARYLYASLTGRVTYIQSQMVVAPDGTYKELIPRELKGSYTTYSAYVQDSWKLSSTLTLTGGLRYDLQMPFKPSISSMTSVTMDNACGVSGLGAGGEYTRCAFNTPGLRANPTIQFDQYMSGQAGYKTDYNNFGPSASLAWRPNVQKGFLRFLFGDPDQATFRAGYAVSYDRQGLATFDNVYPSNPGMTTNTVRSANTANLTSTWPLLLSNPASRTGDQTLNGVAATYPIAIRSGRQDSLYLIAPGVQIGMVQNWMVGFARSLGKDMAVEIRYMGNKGSNEWSTLNYNTVRMDTLQANGFLDEFKLMMANLTANNAAGGSRVGSVAYFGAGTSPLPIAFKHLYGAGDPNDPTKYTASGWSTLAGNATVTSPSPTGAAGTLTGTSAYLANAIAAGLPSNFFLLNPVASGVNVTDSGAFTDYNALQVELRRRLSKGFQASINYQLAYGAGSVFDGFTWGRGRLPQTENALRHSIKLQADYTLPIGRGQKIGGGMSKFADAFAGGWSFTLVGKMQQMTMELGNVRLVGMTIKDVQKMYKYYFKPASTTTTGLKEIWMLPDDVILNTRRAFSTSATTLDGYSSPTTSLGPPTGRYFAPANSAACIQVRPGDCPGVSRSNVLMAPWTYRFDMAVIKKINIWRRVNIELRVDVLNLFDTPNFYPVANPGSGATIFKVTSAYTDASNTYDPGGRIGQLMFRINW